MTIDNSSQVRLSIILTSYTVKRLKDIIELLNSIQAQTYSNVETVFIVERSKELFEQIKAYVDRKGLSNVKVIFNERRLGLSSARNLGIRYAKGDILAFVNDDIVLPSEWAEEMVKTFTEDNSVIGITGPSVPSWEDESIDWLPKEFYWIISCTAWCDLRRIREVRNVWGMNMAFRREAFDSCGYFPTTLGSVIRWQEGSVFFHKLTAEEVVFSLNVKRQTGKRIIFNPKVKVKHKVYGYRLTFGSIAKKSYLIGCERRMLESLFQKGDRGEKILSVEYDLLRRIVRRLLPNTVRGLFRKPKVALRQLQVIFIALFFVATGYLSYLFRSPLEFECEKHENV